MSRRLVRARTPEPVVRATADSAKTSSLGALPATIWLEGLVVAQILGQVLLLVPGLGPARMLLRVLAFGISLAWLVLVPGKGRFHPAALPAAAVLGILGLELLHPETNSWLSGLAQSALYLAILAPLFWMPRIQIDSARFVRVLFLFWCFHSASASVGVLQMYFPGRFEPPVAKVVGTEKDYLESLQIKLQDGSLVYRPMGLTDTPGGAANSGFYIVVLGLALLLHETRPHWQAVYASSTAVGGFCLYLSQVRSLLLLTLLCVIVFAVVLALRGQGKRVVTLLVVMTATTFGSFFWAVTIGQKAVMDRLMTLLSADPGQVYYSNRGRFWEHTVEELVPRYPLGAGLGRWGMMNLYFGDQNNIRSQPLWVEIQWTGWLLDGGLPLVAAYTLAIVLSLWVAWTCSGRDYPPDATLWGALICAYNLGALALTFNYPLFIGQTGLEFWLLNAMLFGFMQNMRPAPTAIPDPRPLQHAAVEATTLPAATGGSG